jgi:hypothetical protein
LKLQAVNWGAACVGNAVIIDGDTDKPVNAKSAEDVEEVAVNETSSIQTPASPLGTTELSLTKSKLIIIFDCPQYALRLMLRDNHVLGIPLVPLIVKRFDQVPDWLRTLT